MVVRKAEKSNATAVFVASRMAEKSILEMVNYIKKYTPSKREFHKIFATAELENRLHAWELTH